MDRRRTTGATGCKTDATGCKTDATGVVFTYREKAVKSGRLLSIVPKTASVPPEKPGICCLCVREAIVFFTSKAFYRFLAILEEILYIF